MFCYGSKIDEVGGSTTGSGRKSMTYATAQKKPATAHPLGLGLVSTRFCQSMTVVLAWSSHLPRSHEATQAVTDRLAVQPKRNLPLRTPLGWGLCPHRFCLSALVVFAGSSHHPRSSDQRCMLEHIQLRMRCAYVTHALRLQC